MSRKAVPELTLLIPMSANSNARHVSTARSKQYHGVKTLSYGPASEIAERVQRENFGVQNRNSAPKFRPCKISDSKAHRNSGCSGSATGTSGSICVAWTLPRLEQANLDPVKVILGSKRVGDIERCSERNEPGRGRRHQALGDHQTLLQ